MNVSSAAPCRCAQSSESSSPAVAKSEARGSIDRYAERGLYIGSASALAVGFGLTAAYAASQGASLPQMFDEFLLPTVILTTIYSAMAAVVTVPAGIIGGALTGVARGGLRS